MGQLKDPSLIPSGRYCYRFVKLAPGEVVPPAGPEMGRAQRECAGHGDTHKEVLCPYFEYSTYRTVRCLYLGQEVLQLFDSPEDVAPQMVARFGTPEAAQAFAADSLLGDSIKVCGVGLEPDPFEGGDDEDPPALNEVDRVGQPVYRHQRHLMPGQWVEHPKWGRGRVTDVRFPFDGPALVLVNFGSVGEQRLLRDEALLRRVPSPGGTAAAPTPPPPLSELPWLAVTGLVGPGDLANGVQWRRSQKRGPRGVPRVVQAGWPPVSGLRAVLADLMEPLAHDVAWRLALGGALWAAAVPAREPLAPDMWPTGVACRWLEITDGRLFGVDDAVVHQQVRDLYEHLKRRMQAMRRKAVDNGNFWPAPQRVQLLLAYKGRLVGLRLRFADGYQPDDTPWMVGWASAVKHPSQRLRPAPFALLSDLKPDDWVEHPHHGVGRATKVVRDQWSFRAQVDFGLHGLHDLALNVARLRRVPTLNAADETIWRSPQAAPWAGLSLEEARDSVGGPFRVGHARRVQPGKPPFKALRGLMADVLAPKIWRDALFCESVWRVAAPVWPLDAQGEEACGGWPGEAGAEGRALDMLNLPEALKRPETRVFLRKVMERWLRRLEALQRKAVANGRWWPGPEFLFVLLSSDGLLGMRLVFPAGFEHEQEIWFEYWHPRARTVRRWPTPLVKPFQSLEEVGLKVVTVAQQYPELARPVAPADPPPLPGCVWLLQTHVAGMAYYQAEQAMDSLQAGSPLQLRREPANAHDALAIEVLTEAGLKLGYVPQNRNPVLARLMDAGQMLQAKVLSVGSFPSDPKPWQTSLPEVRLRIDWRPAEATPIGMDT
jgi:hypothetical protein